MNDTLSYTNPPQVGDLIVCEHVTRAQWETTLICVVEVIEHLIRERGFSRWDVRALFCTNDGEFSLRRYFLHEGDVIASRFD